MKPITKAILATAAVAAVALAVGFSASGQSDVCASPKEHWVLVPMLSKSDYETTVEVTPEVAGEVAARAAGSCGVVSYGIGDNDPMADLELKTTTSEPSMTTAVDPDPVIHELVDDIDAELRANLVEPLEQTGMTRGSPTLSTLAKIAQESQTFHWGRLTVVLPHDGLMVERSPETGTPVALGSEPVSRQVLDEWLPGLRPLRGSCIIILAAGAESRLQGRQVQEAQAELTEVLRRAGVEAAITRSTDIPSSC